MPGNRIRPDAGQSAPDGTEEAIVLALPSKPIVLDGQPGEPHHPEFRSPDENVFDSAGMGVGARRNNYILLIAINQYNSTDLRDLNYPVQDADTLLKILLDRYNFSLDNPENCKSIEVKNETYKAYCNRRIFCLYNEDAERSKIETQLSRMFRFMKEDENVAAEKGETIESQLLVYHSGHGAMKDGVYVFPTQSFKEDGDGNFFSIKDLVSIFDKKNVCKNLLIVTDACYAGRATVGLTGNHVGDFSRDILMSCNSQQLARDLSPFSIALCSFLERNAKKTEFEASALPVLLESTYLKLFNGQKPQQDIQYGKAPTTENGSGSFTFELRDKNSPPVNSLVESFFNHLNFKKEREYFYQAGIINPPANSKDYFIVSSEAADITIEKFRGKIISKTIANKLRRDFDFPLIRNPLHYYIDMNDVLAADDIFLILCKIGNFSGSRTSIAVSSQQEKIETFAGFLATQLTKSVKEDNPVCLSLILKNFKPNDQCHTISTFLFTLIMEVEKFKSNTYSKNGWDRLVLFIISELEPNVIDSKGFLEDKSHYVLDLFKQKNIHSPFFKWFDKIGTLNIDSVDEWFRFTGDAFDASTYKELKKKDLQDLEQEFFSQDKELSIYAFMNELTKKVAYSEAQRDELFSLIFF